MYRYTPHGNSYLHNNSLKLLTQPHHILPFLISYFMSKANNKKEITRETEQIVRNVNAAK